MPVMPERDEDLAMMKTPTRWPAYPVLPMKRVKDDDLEVGLLIYQRHNDRYLWVPGANLFEPVGPLDPRVQNTDPDHFESVILDHGWVVD